MQPPPALRSDRAAAILLYSSPLRQRIKQSIDRLPHRRRQLLYFERRLHSPRVRAATARRPCGRSHQTSHSVRFPVSGTELGYESMRPRYRHSRISVFVGRSPQGNCPDHFELIRNFTRCIRITEPIFLSIRRSRLRVMAMSLLRRNPRACLRSRHHCGQRDGLKR